MNILNRLLKNKLLLLAVTLVLFVLVVVLVSLLFPRVEVPTRTITPISQEADRNFSRLHEGYVYGFNGISFYRQNIGDSTVEMLTNAHNLPVPEAIHWVGDRGAVMVYEGSFTLTEIDELIGQRNEIVDNRTRDYSWYIDFDNGDITFVDEVPIRNNGLAFDESENGFYYVPNLSAFLMLEDAEFIGSEMPLRFFDIAEGQNREIVADMSLTGMESIRLCPSQEYIVCLIARDRNNSLSAQLFGVAQNGEIASIIEDYDEVFPTNRENLFIVFNIEDEIDDEFEIEEYVDVSPTTPYIFDINDGSISRVRGVSIEPQAVFANFEDDESFYMNNYLLSSEGRYVSGSISDSGRVRAVVTDMETREGESAPFIVAEAGSLTDGTSLLNAVNGMQYLFSRNQSLGGFVPININQATRIVEACADREAEAIQFTPEPQRFRVFFEEGSTFNRDIDRFLGCIEDEDISVLSNYVFKIDILDRFSGRIISD